MQFVLSSTAILRHFEDPGSVGKIWFHKPAIHFYVLRGADETHLFDGLYPGLNSFVWMEDRHLEVSITGFLTSSLGPLLCELLNLDLDQSQRPIGAHVAHAVVTRGKVSVQLEVGRCVGRRKMSPLLSTAAYVYANQMEEKGEKCKQHSFPSPTMTGMYM